MICKGKWNKHLCVAVIILGAVSFLFGLLGFLLMKPESSTFNTLLGMFTGFGAGIMGVAIYQLIRSKMVSQEKLEQEYGIACCENRDDLLSLQWDYPHGWACLHYIAVRGLLNYGKKEDALRIAEKYVNVAAKNFEKTENLWEKYNVVTGEVSVTKEYNTPPMMGWSAGVYLYCEQLLEENGRG